MSGEVKRLRFLEGVTVVAPSGFSPDSTRAGIVSLSQGDFSKTILFSTPWANALYVPSVEIICNDANPVFPSYVIQNITANGFTVLFNSPVDSNNYKIAYRITEAQ